MNPYEILHEMTSQHMMETAELNEKVEPPLGAITSIEQLQQVIETSSEEVASTIFLPEYYSIHDQLKYIKPPKRWTKFYEAVICADPKESTIEEVFIESSELFHNVEFLKTSDKNMSRPLYLRVFKFFYLSPNKVMVNHTSIHQIGLDRKNHVSDWFLFANQELAEIYVNWCKANMVQSESSKAFIAAIDSLIERRDDRDL